MEKASINRNPVGTGAHITAVMVAELLLYCIQIDSTFYNCDCCSTKVQFLVLLYATKVTYCPATVLALMLDM